jgi:hypothetical protein
VHLLLLFAASLSCPVLTSASVAGVLGEVQLTVTGSECVFTRADYRLTVEVNQLPAPDKFADFATSNCRGSLETTALRAIGNEAVACRFANLADKIVGRVRNRAFVLFLNTSDKAQDAKSVRTKITALSEQVAGNLF